ncbi:MAG: hypothetical protein Q7R52_00215 [archaeon]|nr:hypothetical protein [archaeon]
MNTTTPHKLEYMKDYYAKNKKRIKEWKATYRKENPEKISQYRKEYRQRDREEWESGRISDSFSRAEQIIRDKILPSLGYKDIYKPTRNFYFDAFAKKGKQIFLVEITTSRERSFPKYRGEFMAYLEFPVLVFHVKPDLSEYWLITGRTDFKGTHYKQGRRAVIS